VASFFRLSRRTNLYSGSCTIPKTLPLTRCETSPKCLRLPPARAESDSVTRGVFPPRPLSFKTPSYDVFRGAPERLSALPSQLLFRAPVSVYHYIFYCGLGTPPPNVSAAIQPRLSNGGPSLENTGTQWLSALYSPVFFAGPSSQPPTSVLQFLPVFSVDRLVVPSFLSSKHPVTPPSSTVHVDFRLLPFFLQ